MSRAVESFGSRWGLVLATLGMAVGTGNIWRFPRVAATYGGGSFLVAWVVFLLLWSVPLMIVEFSFGKRARQGVVGSFIAHGGKGMAWMGAFVAVCALLIGAYYSVVSGWCLRFLAAATTGALASEGASAALWSSFNSTPAAVVTQLIVLAICFSVVWFGVRGIERVAKLLIPTLFVLVLVLTVRAVTLPGAERGLDFLFTVDWAALGSPTIWLQALTQNAWDTGAGWGLIVTYAIYMRAREDVSLNAFLIGFGNNSVSLLAGIMVLCTVFAINPQAQAEIVGAGNEGLTFIWMPELFGTMPGGAFFMVIFFLALTFAAITSLISMLELVTRVFIDLGWTRRRALIMTACATLFLGVPSALKLAIFKNQDWVWGVGLMASGLFFSIAAAKFGLERMRTEVVNAEGCDLRIGRWWPLVVGVLVPVEAITLVIWWLRDAYRTDPENWLRPFGAYSVGTVFLQWAVAFAVLWALNGWLARRTIANAPSNPTAPVDGEAHS